MIFFYLVLALLVLSSIKYQKAGFVDSYLSMDTTNMVKGIFILLVFIKHATPYVLKAGWTPSGLCGDLFYLVDNNVGQWIVTMFLFYSGYGVMESIKCKGREYVSQIPRKRFLNVLLNFDIAVLFFIAINVCLGKNLSIRTSLLSLTGWESVGNSNWYIFIIMMLYLITFISFYKVEARAYKRSLLVSAALTFLLCIGLSFFKSDYWYNTMFCYVAGLIFSTYKESMEKYAQKFYWAIIIGILLLMIVFDFIPYSVKGLVYNSFAVAFCVLVVLVTIKFKINSPVLRWCGKNLFPLYIYQRIPMIVLSSIGGGLFVAEHPIIFTVICLLVTVLFTMLYKYIAIKL